MTYRAWWIALPLAAAAFALALDIADLDRVVQNRLFDPMAGGFPLRYNAFLEVVLHYWTKYLVALVAALAIGGFLLTFTAPALRPHRRTLLFVTLSIVLSTTAVSSLKLVSSKHCPWSLAEYGGLLPYTKLVDPAPPAASPGHCFPAGHASTGFSLLAFYFVGHARRNPRLARVGLALGLGAGLVLGFGRMLQGAHFLSHVLWSGILCWLVILALYLALLDARSEKPGEVAWQPHVPDAPDRPGGSADRHPQHGRWFTGLTNNKNDQLKGRENTCSSSL